MLIALLDLTTAHARGQAADFTLRRFDTVKSMTPKSHRLRIWPARQASKHGSYTIRCHCRRVATPTFFSNRMWSVHRYCADARSLSVLMIRRTCLCDRHGESESHIRMRTSPSPAVRLARSAMSTMWVGHSLYTVNSTTRHWSALWSSSGQDLPFQNGVLRLVYPTRQSQASIVGAQRSSSTFERAN